MPRSGFGRTGSSGSWYAATAPAVEPQPALAGRERADVCVVGAGFTGVSAALHLAERGFSVVVLEAERVGWGASGRNGGQVGSGLRESMDDLERALGPSRAGSLWALAEEAKAIIAERIDRHGIECDWRSGNLLASTRERYMRWMEDEAEFCHRRFGYRGYRMLSRAEMREEVASERYVGGRMDEGGGHLHPPQVRARDGCRGGRGRSPDLRGLARRADPVGPSDRGLDRARGRGDGGARRPRRQRPSRPPRAADRVPDHADRQPSARDRASRRTACPLAREERRVRALDEVRRRLLPVHPRPPPALRGRRDVLRPAPARSRGVRPPLPAPRLPSARGRLHRPRVERAARNHEEPPAARGADRPPTASSPTGSRAMGWH